jgi:hypothetical protein
LRSRCTSAGDQQAVGVLAGDGVPQHGRAGQHRQLAEGLAGPDGLDQVAAAGAQLHPPARHHVQPADAGALAQDGGAGLVVHHRAGRGGARQLLWWELVERAVPGQDPGDVLGCGGPVHVTWRRRS